MPFQTNLKIVAALLCHSGTFLQRAFVYSFLRAQPYSINFGPNIKDFRVKSSVDCILLRNSYLSQFLSLTCSLSLILTHSHAFIHTSPLSHSSIHMHAHTSSHAQCSLSFCYALSLSSENFLAVDMWRQLQICYNLTYVMLSRLRGADIRVAAKLAFETAAFYFDKFSLGPKVIAPTLYTERPLYVSSLRACVLILLVSK